MYLGEITLSEKNFYSGLGLYLVVFITSFFPYDLGGVISIIFWCFPIIAFEYYWPLNKKLFYIVSIASACLSIMIGAVISGTLYDIKIF